MGSELEKLLWSIDRIVPSETETGERCFERVGTPHKQVAAQIRELVMKCVPEKHTHENCIWPECDADFNDCRALTLKRIKEL